MKGFEARSQLSDGCSCICSTRIIPINFIIKPPIYTISAHTGELPLWRPTWGRPKFPVSKCIAMLSSQLSRYQHAMHELSRENRDRYLFNARESGYSLSCSSSPRCLTGGPKGRPTVGPVSGRRLSRRNAEEEDKDPIRVCDQ